MRENYNEILAFIAVARERSFTRAAARLGVTQSALSHSMRALEERLGIRLLTRTTRNVSTTEAGERILQRIAPRFEDIDTELEMLSELTSKPAGLVRISCSDHAAFNLVWPKLSPLLEEYPDIQLEINVENGFTNIVSSRFDAGIRLGEAVEKDMIAVSISPPLRMAVVGSPAYFEKYGIPESPRDLSEHRCINLRLPTYGRLLVWDFEKDGREVNVRVEGQLTVNKSFFIRDAALKGVGLAYLPQDMVKDAVADGRLVRVLEPWCDEFPGYYLYYPNRSQYSPAFSLFVEAMRHQD